MDAFEEPTVDADGDAKSPAGGVLYAGGQGSGDVPAEGTPPLSPSDTHFVLTSMPADPGLTSPRGKLEAGADADEDLDADEYTKHTRYATQLIEKGCRVAKYSDKKGDRAIRSLRLEAGCGEIMWTKTGGIAASTTRLKVSEIESVRHGCTTPALQERSKEHKSWDPAWRCFSLVARSGDRTYDFTVMQDSDVVFTILGLQSAVRGAKGYTCQKLEQQIRDMKIAAGVKVEKKKGKRPLRKAQSARVVSAGGGAEMQDSRSSLPMAPLGEAPAAAAEQKPLGQRLSSSQAELEQQLEAMREALGAEVTLRESVQAENVSLKGVIEQLQGQLASLPERSASSSPAREDASPKKMAKMKSTDQEDV